MLFTFQSSFDRCFKKLTPQKQRIVLSAIEELQIFYDTNLLIPGLGLKNLRKQYWEIRATLQDRIIFSLKDNTINFVLVGNHEDVRKFLKNL